MGDRANIVIETNSGGKSAPLFIYSHWDGLYGMAEKLHRALKRKQRWNDDSYLTRIIVDEVLKGAAYPDTGYGISRHEQDNEHPFLCVDIAAQKVFLRPAKCGNGGSYKVTTKPTNTWTFDEYVALDPATVGAE